MAKLLAAFTMLPEIGGSLEDLQVAQFDAFTRVSTRIS